MSDQGMTWSEKFDDTKGGDKKPVVVDVVNLLKAAGNFTKEYGSTTDGSLIAQGFPALTIDTGDASAPSNAGKRWGNPNWNAHQAGSNDVTKDENGRITLAHVDGKTEVFQYDKDGKLSSAISKDDKGNVETLQRVGNKYMLKRGKAGTASADESLPFEEEVKDVVVNADGSITYNEVTPAQGKRF